METIGIIGQGKFGSFLCELLQKHCPTLSQRVYDNATATSSHSLEETCASDIIIPCVPIRNFSECLTDITPHLSPGQVLIDVCSVKLHIKEVFSKQLPEGVHAICTHPMFGPATYEKRKQGSEQPLQDLSVHIENISAPKDMYEKIIAFLKACSLRVIEISADEHDRLTSHFQFLTLFQAAVLKEVSFRESNLDTESFKMLKNFLDFVSTDTRLLKDMITYNPYCKEELSCLKSAYDNLFALLDGTQA